jgi:hypothetical protein
MLSKKRTEFFGFGKESKVSFTLMAARLAELLDMSAQTGSLLPKNNSPLTMFPQKGFIWVE